MNETEKITLGEDHQHGEQQTACTGELNCVSCPSNWLLKKKQSWIRPVYTSGTPRSWDKSTDCDADSCTRTAPG